MPVAITPSALEFVLRQQEQWAKVTPYYERIKVFSRTLFDDSLRDPRKAATIWRMRRAPQTDDMRQMLDDIGVTPATLAPSRLTAAERGPIKITITERTILT